MAWSCGEDEKPHTPDQPWTRERAAHGTREVSSFHRVVLPGHRADRVDGIYTVLRRPRARRFQPAGGPDVRTSIRAGSRSFWSGREG
jgi:hypothetical protein